VKDSSYKTDPNPETTKLGNSERKKALIVDDETDICYLLSSILKQADIQPVFAGSITEAEKMLHSTNLFYYVFLDNHLPDGFGLNQVKKWKKEFPSMHLIMITAHDSYEERRKASTDGADFFIAKPFSKEMILNTVVPTSD
jgi:DNA-binding NtrC family response regulator